MTAGRLIPIIAIAACTVYGQAPNPVQRDVRTTVNGTQPVFHIDVTSRTVAAVNYHNRQGMTKINFRGTALMPEARGEANVTANTGATRVSLHFDHLSNPSQYGPEFQTLVLWGITPEGRAERMGEVTLKHPGDKTAELYATTDLQTYGMIITAEPYFSVSQPSDVVVMENFLRDDTTGTLEHVDAKFELLKRGVYTLNVQPGSLATLTSDVSIPLELREAHEAMAIARAQGADTYAPDTMQKAAIDIQNAEGFYHSHKEKEMITDAREATQMAEDARRISIEKERAEADRAAKEAQMAANDAAARAKADAEQEARLRAEADSQRAAAEAQRASAEQQKREAEMATAQAREAQQQADAARQAALAEQQRLAAEKDAAEKDTQALRERLRAQLNLILQTSDTARGLIVNMSDVLFDFGKDTLKPGAREKLAKVSGILLAYPTLHLAIEGHTDSIGSDEYNMKLSERRAFSVRDYLVSNGINQANTTAAGFGKAGAVASNDTDSGRQQNRRVELVVSGDVIGQPVSKDPVSQTNPSSGLNSKTDPSMR